MPQRCGIIVFAVSLMLAANTWAAPPPQFVTGTSKTAVTRSGAVFTATPSWRRVQSGGIADSVGQVVFSGGKVYAIASRTPIYELRDRAWHTVALTNRGRTFASTEGSKRALLVGRHVYTLRNHQWRYTFRTSVELRAIWLGKRDSFGISARDRLVRKNGTRWTTVRFQLATGDVPDRLFGVSNSYVISRQGVVARIRGSRTQVLPAASPHSTWQPTATASTATTSLIGGVTKDSAAILLLVNGNTLQRLDIPTDFTRSETIAALWFVAPDKAILTSSAGRLWRLDSLSSPSSWQSMAVATQASQPAPTPGKQPFRLPAPAH